MMAEHGDDMARHWRAFTFAVAVGAATVLPGFMVGVLALQGAFRRHADAFGRLGVDIPAVSIGPETTRAAREAGVEVVREAPTHDVAGLLAAIGSAACSSPS